MCVLCSFKRQFYCCLFSIEKRFIILKYLLGVHVPVKFVLDSLCEWVVGCGNHLWWSARPRMHSHHAQRQVGILSRCAVLCLCPSLCAWVSGTARCFVSHQRYCLACRAVCQPLVEQLQTIPCMFHTPTPPRMECMSLQVPVDTGISTYIKRFEITLDNIFHLRLLSHHKHPESSLTCVNMP